jgi:hypothetical protein
VIIARIVALVNPACVGLSLLPGRHTCFLRLPQVDRECSVQIRNMGCRSWNNRKYADIDDYQSFGIITIKPKRTDSRSRSEFHKGGRQHSRLATSLAKVRVS